MKQEPQSGHLAPAQVVPTGSQLPKSDPPSPSSASLGERPLRLDAAPESEVQLRRARRVGEGSTRKVSAPTQSSRRHRKGGVPAREAASGRRRRCMRPTEAVLKLDESVATPNAVRLERRGEWWWAPSSRRTSQPGGPMGAIACPAGDGGLRDICNMQAGPRSGMNSGMKCPESPQ
jgi:hypothetical protein